MSDLHKLTISPTLPIRQSITLHTDQRWLS